MIKVIDVIKKFNLELINKDDCNVEKIIERPSIHRLGLALAGKLKKVCFNNVIGWGTVESLYLSSLKKEKAIESINYAINNKTPMIILSLGFSQKLSELLKKECLKFKIPIIKSKMHISTINMTIGGYLIDKFAPVVNIHGSLIVVNGIGVMIIGKSGIGKSEAVLELIQRQHIFVSDDTVVIKKIGKNFFGKSTPLTKNFLESRGLGIIDIQYTYGKKSIIDKTMINLVIELVLLEEVHNIDRLGIQNLKYNVLDGEIDKIQIPVKNGQNISSLIEAAVNVQATKNKKIQPLDIIAERNK